MGTALVALLTVAAGIAAAILLFFLLDRLAGVLPKRAGEIIKPYLYILPAFGAIGLYLVYPAIGTIINSFKDAYSYSYVGFANYQHLFTNDAFRQTLFNTLLWVLIVPIATVVIGLAVATLADRLQPKGEKLAKTIIFLPMAVSLVGASTVWRFIYAYEIQGQPQIGLFNGIREAFGGGPVAWLQVSNFHLNSLLLMLILLWSQVGFAMVLLSAAVKGVPTDTLEAARIDGASERQIFFRVVLPQIMGSVITVLITVTIGVMKIFDVVFVNGNGNFNTNVLGNQFYNEITTNNDYGSASAIVVILMIAVLPIMVIQIRRFRTEEANA